MPLLSPGQYTEGPSPFMLVVGCVHSRVRIRSLGKEAWVVMPAPQMSPRSYACGILGVAALHTKGPGNS